MERKQTLKLKDRFRSFLHGAVTIVDLSGELGLRRSRKILERSDGEALKSDWEAVSKDLESVIKI